MCARTSRLRTCVDANVSSKVEIEREALAAAFERALERLLARVHQLMSLQLARLDKRLAAFGANVNARAMRVQMFTHR